MRQVSSPVLKEAEGGKSKRAEYFFFPFGINAGGGPGAAPLASGAGTGGARNLERIPGCAAAAAAAEAARGCACELVSRRASAPGIGSGGVEAGRLRLPDASATRSIQAPGASGQAGGRSRGRATELGGGAGKDSASAARCSAQLPPLGLRDPTLLTTLAPSDRLTTNPVKRNRPKPNFLFCYVPAVSPWHPGLSSAAAASVGAGTDRRTTAVPRSPGPPVGREPRWGGGSSPRGADRESPPPP